MRLTKEAKEFIDRICEDSVNTPPVFDNGIFVTDDARLAEDDRIAEIANLTAECVIDKLNVEDILDQLQGKQGMIETLSRIVSILFHILEMLNWEVEQRRRQMLNLERRLFALEEKLKAKGDKYAYK